MPTASEKPSEKDILKRGWRPSSTSGARYERQWIIPEFLVEAPPPRRSGEVLGWYDPDKQSIFYNIEHYLEDPDFLERHERLHYVLSKIRGGSFGNVPEPAEGYMGGLLNALADYSHPIIQTLAGGPYLGSIPLLHQYPQRAGWPYESSYLPGPTPEISDKLGPHGAYTLYQLFDLWRAYNPPEKIGILESLIDPKVWKQYLKIYGPPPPRYRELEPLQ